MHLFLRRFVLGAVRASGFSGAVAVGCTFALSIAAHEAIIASALGRCFRTPWLALASIAQGPLISLMNARAVKGTRLGSFCFWTGIMFGLSLVLTLCAFAPGGPERRRR